jgi:hypothetical protein
MQAREWRTTSHAAFWLFFGTTKQNVMISTLSWLAVVEPAHAGRPPSTHTIALQYEVNYAAILGTLCITKRADAHRKGAPPVRLASSLE